MKTTSVHWLDDDDRYEAVVYINGIEENRKWGFPSYETADAWATAYVVVV